MSLLKSRINSLFRTSIANIPVNLSTVIARAFVFSAILTLLYCRLIIWRSFADTNSSLFWNLVSILAFSWQDFIVLILLAGCAWILEKRRSSWQYSIIIMLLALLVMFVTVANVYAMHIVGSPLDSSWLGELNLRDAGTTWPMITTYISASMKKLAVISFIIVPLICLIISRFLVKRLTACLILLFVGAFAAFICQLAIGAASLPAEKRFTFTNPVFTELHNLVSPSKNLKYLNGKVKTQATINKPSYQQQPVHAATFDCCRDQNIVFITIDTVPQKAIERALSTNTTSKYPNLSELFNNGIVFKNFYANFPLSAQSMGSMATSVHPSFSPVLTTMEELQDKEVEILSSVLSHHGYHNALFMSGQLKYAGAYAMMKGRGFDTIIDSDTIKCNTDDNEAMALYAHLGDDCTAQAASRWINDHGNKKFFLWVWFTNPHSPYFVRARAKTGGTLGSAEQHMAALAETDTAIGVLRNKLKTKRILDKTIFVIVGDHGEAFGEHGQLNHGSSVYEEQVHVPLVFSGGNLPSHSQQLYTIGSMVDLAPSILDIVGISSPTGWQGRSLFAKDHPNQAFFASRRSGKMVGLRVGNIKYILSNLEEGIIAYNLEKDPGEQKPFRLDTDTEKKIMTKISGYVAYRKAMRWPTKATNSNEIRAA